MIEYYDSPVFHESIVQGSEEWHNIRKGKITGSVVKTLLVNGKQEGGFGTGAITEMYKIIEERYTGEIRESFSNKATDHGHQYEDEAAEVYELENFVVTDTIGFVQNSKQTGCSPDRIIPEYVKGLEIKCFPTKHAEIYDTKQHGKPEYIQCQYNLWVTGYKEWDLWYYHPHLPPVKFTFRPDMNMFKEFETRLLTFETLVKQKLQKYPTKKKAT